MKVTITHDVYSHHTNKDYQCVVVKFERGDAFFVERMDWMPRYSEMKDILLAFVKCNPDYARELLNILKDELSDTYPNNSDTLKKWLKEGDKP